MEQNYCLNCSEEISKKFCASCGQKTDTHRITLKHFVVHDLLHGVWHIDKGILFTVKESLMRPGNAALDYIGGKRIQYYNVFYLILILVGFNIFLADYYERLKFSYFLETTPSVNPGVDDFFANYAKLMILSLVPFFTLSSFIVFNKKKLNLAEHFILSGMIFLGVMLITTTSLIVSFLDFTHLSVLSKYVDRLTPLLLLFYIGFGYFNAFRHTYKTSNLLLRIIGFNVLLFIELLLAAIPILIFTNFFDHA